MNANAAIERYAPTLDTFLPGCPEGERRTRCGILYLRDRATAATRTAGWEAGMVLHGLEGLATAYAFRGMPSDQLDTLHAALVRLMMVARSLEMRGPRSAMNDDAEPMGARS